jgi:hypothetical protein
VESVAVIWFFVAFNMDTERGAYGATLLYFAVTQSWQRPELVAAVTTLLTLGVDPNCTNGKRNSFAMANAVHASEPVLHGMLEEGEIRTLVTSSASRLSSCTGI